MLKLRTQLPSLEGATEWLNGTIPPDRLTGRPVVVHFWAISCGICKPQLSTINEWIAKYGDRVTFVGVHMPLRESDTNVDDVRATAGEYGLEHPQAIDNQHAIAELFSNEVTPAFYVFDREGLLRHVQVGEKAPPMVEQSIARYAGGPTAEEHA